jgi:hypothetical protein
MLQWNINKQGNVEYHIRYKVKKSFETNFLEATQEDFSTVVYDYIEEHFKHLYVSIGYDSNYGVYGCKKYTWIHLNMTTAKDDITLIMTQLHQVYTNNWSKHNICKLTAIIKNKIAEDATYLAQSVSHYQNINGFHATQSALHIMFNSMNIGLSLK